MNEPTTIRSMLALHTIAVIGLSDNPAKPSYAVSDYMQAHGYHIVPVNPLVAPGTLILGQPVYPSLSAIPFRPDIVNVFRLPDYIPAIVNEMIALRLKNLWIQLGIRNVAAAATAESAGIAAVMDRCLLIEHRNLAFS